MTAPPGVTDAPTAAPGARRAGPGPGPVLAALERTAAAHRRPDLAVAARSARQRLDSATFRIAVIGEYKKGKSSLVNALVGAEVTAVDDDLATVAPVEVGYSRRPVARIWLEEEDGSVADRTTTVEEAVVAATRPTTRLVRVGLPRRLLAGGLVLVDTPGVGGLSSAAAVGTASTLADAHAVVFVTDAGQELTRAELDALVDAAARCPEVLLVETKVDVQPHWREVVDADRRHLAAHGLDIPVLCVGTELRRLALAHDDPVTNRESGYVELLAVLSGRFSGSARGLVERGAWALAQRLVDHLRQPLVAERDGLVGGAGGDPAGAVAGAVAALERFREQAGAWPQVLADGMADLASEADHRLRTSFRELLREVEEVIDSSDPDQVWPELEPRLHRRAAELVDADVQLVRRRASELADRLAEVIDSREPAALDVVAPGPDGGARGPEDRAGAPLDLDRHHPQSTTVRAQQAFRAGYGGAMPVMVVGGMVLGVLGVGTLVLPLAGVAGALAGRRALADDRERQLRQRRQQARAIVRKHLEEVLDRAAHDSRANQRRVQRALRDHMTERVARLSATHRRTVQRAEAAAAAGAAERQRRLASVEEQIARLDRWAAVVAGGLRG